MLFCIAIALIVYILPKQSKFKYEFQNLKGKPWHYDNLVAPFDFAIKKTNAELTSEKAEIIKNTKPYFKLDNTIAAAKKKTFVIDFEKKWAVKPDNKNKKLQEETFALGNKIMDSIYSKGIIEPSENIENRPSDYSIYVIDNNVAEENDLKDFYTIVTAYEYVKKQLDNNKSADTKFLLPLLEDGIAHTEIGRASCRERV